MKLNVSEVPVLRRVSPFSREEALTTLLSAMPAQKDTQPRTEKSAERNHTVGEGWRLDVFADGSAAEFIDEQVSETARKGAQTRSAPLSHEKLESLAREYISRVLGKIVTIDAGESLVPEFAATRAQGGVAPDGGSSISSVTGHRIIFTREIAGLPVVGAGSKVTVTFTNEGAVESFRYDWPSYQRSDRVESLVDASEILARIQRIALTRVGERDDGDRRKPPVGDKPPLALGGGAELQRLSCGYYDPGHAVQMQGGEIQPGCLYHVLHRRGEGDQITTAGYSGAVPAGKSFTTEKNWPETLLLTGERIPEAKPGGQAEPPTSVRPTPPREK